MIGGAVLHEGKIAEMKTAREDAGGDSRALSQRAHWRGLHLITSTTILRAATCNDGADLS